MTREDTLDPLDELETLYNLLYRARCSWRTTRTETKDLESLPKKKLFNWDPTEIEIEGELESLKTTGRVQAEEFNKLIDIVKRLI